MTEKINNPYMLLEYQKLLNNWLLSISKAKAALLAENVKEYTRHMRLAQGKRKQMDSMLADIENSIYY